MTTHIALLDVTTEGCRAAQLDSAHDPTLQRGERSGMILTER